jgi:hypothetical protein
MYKRITKKNKKWAYGVDMAHAIESFKNENTKLKYVSIGAFIGFLVIISIFFILGWVIV